MHADEYAAMVASQMSEATFQTQLLRLATDLGWRCYHTHDSRRSQAGFPDLVMVRPPRLIFAELKRQSTRSQPTSQQQAWLEALAEVAAALASAGPDARIEVHLWRPSDITTNTIAEVLR